MSFASGLGSVAAGLINSGRSLPTIDLAPIFATIDKAGADRENLIKKLPQSLQEAYSKYSSSLKESGQTLQDTTQDIGQTLLDRTQSLYGPDSPAVKATLDALRTKTYSTLPGTLNTLKANLAATGGLQRGGASRAITQAVLQPAATFSQQSQDVLANQLMTQQGAVQQAYNKIAGMDDATAQSLFGMTTAEASNILQFGRQDLKDQLTDLINNINTVSGQKLSAQGIAANNAYQNAVTRNAQQAAIVNGLAQLPAQFIDDQDKQVDRVMGMIGGGGEGGGGGLMDKAGPAAALMLA